MEEQDPKPIVLDTSILLNFVKIGRVELLGQLGALVVLLDQVLDEVRRPEQRKVVKDAVAAGTLDLQSVRNPVEVALFIELRAGGRLGAGEEYLLTDGGLWANNPSLVAQYRTQQVAGDYVAAS